MKRKGKVLESIDSWTEGEPLFHKGEIVEAGYHTSSGEMSDAPDEYIWIQDIDSRREADYLSADDVQILP